MSYPRYVSPSRDERAPHLSQPVPQWAQPSSRYPSVGDEATLPETSSFATARSRGSSHASGPGELSHTVASSDGVDTVRPPTRPLPRAPYHSPPSPSPRRDGYSSMISMDQTSVVGHAFKRPRLSPAPRAIIIAAPGDPSGSEGGSAAGVEEKYTRDPDFWLEDGNLILLAGHSAFRVYRGLLAKFSPVFADMFTTGSAGATETFHNCPVVRLADHPEDLRDFLQYLMPCSVLELVDEVPECHFEQLHAAFHLAHKYQCEDVEARILFVLKKFYTSNFNDHDRYATSKYTLVPPPLQAAVAAVNIARLTDTPSMLPLALYLVCTLEGRAVDGYEPRDGSTEHLSAEDLKLCMNARGTLAWELAALARTVFSSTEYPGPDCKHPEKCLVAEGSMFQEAQGDVPGECDVLEPYQESVDEWAKTYRMCKGCKRKLLARDREERRQMWMRLPGVFGFTVEECGFTNGDE